MKIDDQFPSPSELLKLELETLKVLRANAIITEKFPQFFANIDQSFILLQNNIKKGHFTYNFCGEFEYTCNEGYPLIFHISALVSGTELHRKKSVINFNYDEVSYFVSISRLEKKKIRILRKYHFDYVNKKNNQPGPNFHLQYAGTLNHIISEYEIVALEEEGRIDSWFESPRIIFTPTSIALLLDMIFEEFPTQEIIRLTEDNEWCGVILANEEKLLKPFFQNCSLAFNRCNRENLFTRHFSYGKVL